MSGNKIQVAGIPTKGRCSPVTATVAIGSNDMNIRVDPGSTEFRELQLQSEVKQKCYYKWPLASKWLA